MTDRPRGLPLALALALTAILSAILGFAVASWRAAPAAEENARRLREMQAQLRCDHYWNVRNGTADAEYQYHHGRRSLLEIVGATDPSIEYEVPGVRRGAVVATTRDVPVSGPRLEQLDAGPRGPGLPSLCRLGLYNYVVDYNVAMMKLLGRSGDTYLRSISPEILAPDLEAAARREPGSD